MRTGRIVTTCLAVAAVGGCAVVAIGMAQAAADRHPQVRVAADAVVPAVASSIPAQRPAPSSSATSSSPTVVRPTRSTTRTAGRTTPATRPSSSATARPSTASSPKPTVPAGTPTRAAVPQHVTPVVHATIAHPAPTHAAPALRRGGALPLRMSTGNATRVITVVASSTSSTTAWLQPWVKAPGGGWLRWGPRVVAHIGADGMTWSPSESLSATPMGSYTLTRAFGHDTNPGTPLPYVHTNPSYWWISQSGPLYNTMQSCWSNCAFNQGDPNEHLYYETPYYNYAVVIDYNTRNAGAVRQGAGSAFFLHVTDGTPTAGCVAIPQWRLVQIMRWLAPSAHPRILIGTAG